MRRLFPGYGTAFLPSLVVTVSELSRDGDALLPKRNETEPRRLASCRRADTLNSSCRAPMSDGKNNGPAVPDVEDLLFDACVERLITVATPETMCRLHRWNETCTIDMRRATGEHDV